MGDKFLMGMVLGVAAGAVLSQSKCCKNFMAKGKDMVKQATDSVTSGQSNNNQG